jgi:hypothetical protein
MAAHPILRPILRDEALTRNLADPEARVLVEWLVEQAERLAAVIPGEMARVEVQRLRLRGRAIARFVRLWCYDHSTGPAAQLAACERFDWPLPHLWKDPCEVMQGILAYEVRSVDRFLKRNYSAA